MDVDCEANDSEEHLPYFEVHRVGIGLNKQMGTQNNGSWVDWKLW
jgi:hypothetical protein